MALALFGLTLLTRLPFATTNLYAPDAVLYVRGMERFDPFDQQPQPPGYLWYVLVLRAIAFVTHEPNRAMTIVAAVAGAATVALVYLLAARLYDERTAKVSALFVLTAVTFCAYGGVAYPYTLLAATRATIATAALSAAMVGALVGAWVFASGLADGGVARFLEAVRIQSKFVDDRYSIFGNGPIAIYRNAYELGRFLGRGLYFLIPLVVVMVISTEARRIELRDRWRTAFIGLWLLMPLAFYLFIHVGEYGYIFSMLPGLAIVAARGSIALAKGMRMPRTFKWIVMAVVLGNAAIFLLSDTPISARDIARHDRGIDEKVAALAPFPADSTLVVTAYDDVLVNYYLHGPAVLRYDPIATPAFTEPLACDAASSHKPCSGTDVAVVLWDDLLRAEGSGWQEVRMPHGGRLRIAHVGRSASLRVSEGLGVEIVR